MLASRRGKLFTGAMIGILAWGLLWWAHSQNFLESYELKTYDQLCRLNAPSSPVAGDIALIVVDQGSLRAAQSNGINWPWPRQMYAPIIEYCASSGAKSIAFDVLFTEPSSYGMEDDRLLAESLKQYGQGFLPIFLSRENRSQEKEEKGLVERIALPLQDQSLRSFPPYLSSVPPIPVLAQAVRGMGNVAIPPDADGIYRRLPLVFRYGDRWIPSLGFAVYQHLYGKDLWTLKRDGLQSKGTDIPLDPQGNFLLSYYLSGRDFPRYSAFNVVQSFQALQEGGTPMYPPEVFHNKIVFVGFTAPGLFDLKPTPIHSLNPGLAIHATLLANLIYKDFRVRVSAITNLLLAAAVALTVCIIVMMIPVLWQLALMVIAYGGGLFLLVMLAFRENIWIDGVLMAASLGLPFATSVAFSYATEGRQRRQIKQTFSRYMSDLLIQDLLKHPEKLRLGGEKRVLTVFFSDLAGFTSLSERLSPEEVVTLLNRYLTTMTDIILAGGGLIDKYEGDAIMAFWGAPIPQEDHAARACLAALDNQKRLAELREEFIHMGLPPVHARIGINTGEMIIGNMGSNQRFDFTVIGDSVNLASRLEGAGKEYGTRILISEETYRQASGQVEVREVDWLRVKGKEMPVRIYELLARKGELDAVQKQVRDLFAQGMVLYRQRQWVEALAIFQRILTLVPEDGPASTFSKRCEDFRLSPPAADWDGVYRLTSK